MINQSKKTKPVVSISKAAELLSVSIDTIRRWDKKGVLHSIRPDGKNRFFFLEELEKIKASHTFSISEVSEKLGISSSTLRRLETKGILIPKRNENNERIYTKEMVEEFLNSEYYLRQQEVQEQILEPFTQKKENFSYKKTSEKVLFFLEEQNRKAIIQLQGFRKNFIRGFLFTVGVFVILTLSTTASYLLSPSASISEVQGVCDPPPQLCHSKSPVVVS